MIIIAKIIATKSLTNDLIFIDLDTLIQFKIKQFTHQKTN